MLGFGGSLVSGKGDEEATGSCENIIDSEAVGLCGPTPLLIDRQWSSVIASLAHTLPRWLLTLMFVMP